MASSSQATSAFLPSKPLLSLLKELPSPLRRLTFPELFFNPPGQPRRQLTSAERLALEELPELREAYLNDSGGSSPRRCFALLKGEEILFFSVTSDQLFSLGSRAASMGDHSLFTSCGRPLLEQLFPPPLFEQITALTPSEELLIAESSLPELKSELNLRDGGGRAPLHLAAIEGDLKRVEALLSLGCDPSLLTSEGEHLLHLAVCNGSAPLVALLLQQPSAQEWLNQRDLDGRSPAPSSGLGRAKA